MVGPTVNPRFEGNVHGVVVHAKKKISPSTFLIFNFSFLIALNIATALVSFTSLYVPGWFNSCDDNPVPAAGE